MESESVSRRTFVSRAASAAFGVTIVPRHVLGGPGYLAPSDTVNIGMIGAGGMAASNAYAVAEGGQNIVALADVDFPHVERSIANRGRDNQGNPIPAGIRLQEQYAKAKRYDDWRRMLEREKGIDAVIIATPDHSHAVAAKRAMEAGKHVYVQKPLTYTVEEARVLDATARRTGVVTQMGNQGHSMETSLRVNEVVQAGVLGPVREVHVWTNRPIWPQGVPRPNQLLGRPTNLNWNQGGVVQSLAGGMGGTFTVPPTVKWDLFLGPAPYVEYHPIYHPFNWRGWADWGVGALGDMGAHLIDHPYMALGLEYPTAIEATSTPWGGDPRAPASYPQAMMVTYDFPARGAQPPVRMIWYDGGLMAPRPAHFPVDKALNRGGGVFIVGDRGVMSHDQWGRDMEIYPESLREEAARVPQRYPRLVTTTHEMEWVDSIRLGRQANSPFSYASRLTEVMLLGLVAARAGQGVRLLYDGAQMRVTNVPSANDFLKRTYRPGWEL